MPEGDTVHKLAVELHSRLGGRELRGGEVRGRPDLALGGRTVERVEAQGKHMFVHLDGVWIRSHLGMHGAWHRYAPGERWKKPRNHAGIILEVEGDVLVCFHPEELEVGDAAAMERFRLTRRLGPDLVQLLPEVSEVQRRADVFLEPEAPIVDLLLDQRVACGIGNVYKSELLFIHRRSPLASRATFSTDELTVIYADAHRLLRANLHAGPRATRLAGDGEDLWVYGRSGRPCLNCGANIETARLGRGARDTFWCPSCQPE